MKIKVTTTGTFWAYVPDLGREAECEYVRKEYVDVPDEAFIGLRGYAPVNIIYDAGNRFRDAAQHVLTTTCEIDEEGLAKDIPYLDRPFESVKEMREFLSREDVIEEFENE